MTPIPIEQSGPQFPPEEGDPAAARVIALCNGTIKDYLKAAELPQKAREVLYQRISEKWEKSVEEIEVKK